eukprot:gene2521-523_t
MSTHPLDGDGITSLLFHHLAKRKKQNLESCQLFNRCGMCLMPLAIAPVFSNHARRACYFHRGHVDATAHLTHQLQTGSRGMDEGVKVKISKEFEPEQERESFVHGAAKGQVVASFMSVVPSHGDRWSSDSLIQHTARTQFFDADGLRDFLKPSTPKPNGILQKFLFPVGDSNTTIQAIWSPQVILTEARRNKHRLSDTRVPLFERCCTFEGPGALTSQVDLSAMAVDKLMNACQDIVDHFEATDHQKITRMVLYFKVDHTNQLRLLYSTSIRVAETSLPNDLHGQALKLDVRLLNKGWYDEKGKEGLWAKLQKDLGPIKTVVDAEGNVVGRPHKEMTPQVLGFTEPVEFSSAKAASATYPPLSTRLTELPAHKVTVERSKGQTQQSVDRFSPPKPAFRSGVPRSYSEPKYVVHMVGDNAKVHMASGEDTPRRLVQSAEVSQRLLSYSRYSSFFSPDPGQMNSLLGEVRAMTTALMMGHPYNPPPPATLPPIQNTTVPGHLVQDATDRFNRLSQSASQGHGQTQAPVQSYTSLGTDGLPSTSSVPALPLVQSAGEASAYYQQPYQSNQPHPDLPAAQPNTLYQQLANLKQAFSVTNPFMGFRPVRAPAQGTKKKKQKASTRPAASQEGQQGAPGSSATSQSQGPPTASPLPASSSLAARRRMSAGSPSPKVDFPHQRGVSHAPRQMQKTLASRSATTSEVPHSYRLLAGQIAGMLKKMMQQSGMRSPTKQDLTDTSQFSPKNAVFSDLEQPSIGRTNSVGEDDLSASIDLNAYTTSAQSPSGRTSGRARGISFIRNQMVSAAPVPMEATGPIPPQPDLNAEGQAKVNEEVSEACTAVLAWVEDLLYSIYSLLVVEGARTEKGYYFEIPAVLKDHVPPGLVLAMWHRLGIQKVSMEDFFYWNQTAPSAAGLRQITQIAGAAPPKRVTHNKDVLLQDLQKDRHSIMEAVASRRKETLRIMMASSMSGWKVDCDSLPHQDQRYGFFIPASSRTLTLSKSAQEAIEKSVWQACLPPDGHIWRTLRWGIYTKRLKKLGLTIPPAAQVLKPADIFATYNLHSDTPPGEPVQSSFKIDSEPREPGDDTLPAKRPTSPPTSTEPVL